MEKKIVREVNAHIGVAHRQAHAAFVQHGGEVGTATAFEVDIAVAVVHRR